MKWIVEKLFGKKYLEWDEYKTRLDLMEEDSFEKVEDKKFNISS